MSKYHTRALADLVATGQNAGITISDLESADMYIFGTFVATVQVQVSPDGTNFVNEGSAVTAGARVALPDTAQQVRLDVTAFTSGTIESAVGGLDTDVKD